MSLYAADGSFRVTVVDGSTYTGLYAADDSYNVVVVVDTGFTGPQNACGAYNVVLNNTGDINAYAACGAYNVQLTPYTAGGMPVTVVSGSLTPITGSHPTFFILGF